MPRGPEARLQDKIRTKVKKRMGDNGFIYKAQADPRQHKGIPDFVGCYFRYFFIMEIKTPTGKVTKNQAEVIRRMKIAGAFGGVVRDVPQAMKILDNIERHARHQMGVPIGEYEN